MPAQPTWFQKLDEILGVLRGLPVSHLDRRAMEKLFGVGERRARQLMNGLPCLQVGNAVAVERLALITRFENLARSPDCEREMARRERVEKKLEELRRQARARKVELPVPREILDRRADNLASAIRLTPGELTIRFDGPRDLAGKLFELSQAMINDWGSFEKRCK